MRSKQNNSSCLSIGIAIAAVLALTQWVAETEAFSVYDASRASLITTTSRAVPPSILLSSHHDVPSPLIGTSLHATLRDLVELSSNDNVNNKDGKADKSIKKRNAAAATTDTDDFNNLRNYSRSKFIDTKFRSRSIYGTGGSDYEEERGLINNNADRLSAYSFSTTSLKSGSEGGTSTIDENVVEDEEKMKMSEVEGEESPSVVAENTDVAEGTVKSLSTDKKMEAGSSPSSITNEEVVVSSTPKLKGDTMIADNFNDMVGLYYSNRKYPTQSKKKTISDDESDSLLGLHGDRLSTFSFSEKEPPVMVARRSSSSSFGLEEEEEDTTKAGTDVGKDEAGEKLGEAKTSTSSKNDDFHDGDLGVDNFHNSINANSMYRTSAPAANGGSETKVIDGLDNHYDRLSTFTFGDKEDQNEEDTSSAGRSSKSLGPSGGGSFRDRGYDRLSTFSIGKKNEAQKDGAAGKRSLGPSVTRSFRDKVNHDDRLGTFSFASMDLQSGSTSSGGTTAKNPLANASESSIKPTQSTRRSKSTSGTNQSSNNNISQMTTNYSKTDQVYSFPSQKGSLSSLASSVYTKSRIDRIKEIKEATDPRILHPDGMNVPRLNSKGDVMSLSSTSGSNNIFQRIDKSNDAGVESNEGEEGDRPSNKGSGGGGASGSFLRNLAEDAEARSKDLPVERSPGFVGFQSDLEREKMKADEEEDKEG